MIRRDYILRMIEEFFQVLARLDSLKKGELWGQASGMLDEEFQRLIGAGPQAVAQLSETELIARIIKDEPSQVVHDKILMLTALLKEAGDIAAGSGNAEQSRACYLKGLHLLLGALAQGEISDCPAFVPRVEGFVMALATAPLPLETQAALMQHYERGGEFAKAEDYLYAMLEAEPNIPKLVEFGIRFYERLQAHSDLELEEGKLPRPEVEAGLADLRLREQAAVNSPSDCNPDPSGPPRGRGPG